MKLIPQTDPRQQFIDNAIVQGVRILYHGTWHALPEDVEEAWAYAARARAALDDIPGDHTP